MEAKHGGHYTWAMRNRKRQLDGLQKPSDYCTAAAPLEYESCCRYEYGDMIASGRWGVEGRDPEGNLVRAVVTQDSQKKWEEVLKHNHWVATCSAKGHLDRHKDRADRKWKGDSSIGDPTWEMKKALKRCLWLHGAGILKKNKVNKLTRTKKKRRRRCALDQMTANQFVKAFWTRQRQRLRKRYDSKRRGQRSTKYHKCMKQYKPSRAPRPEKPETISDLKYFMPRREAKGGLHVITHQDYFDQWESLKTHQKAEGHATDDFFCEVMSKNQEAKREIEIVHPSRLGIIHECRTLNGVPDEHLKAFVPKVPKIEIPESEEKTQESSSPSEWKTPTGYLNVGRRNNHKKRKRRKQHE